MSSENKARIINEVVKRLWAEEHDAAITLEVSYLALQLLSHIDSTTDHLISQRYIAETDHIKDIMQAVVKDIGYAMMELDLRDEKAVALNRCKHDLAHAVDEHNRLTKDDYDRTFRPRFNCTVKSLKVVLFGGSGGDADTSAQDGEPQMELVLRFPVSEYKNSPHSLVPGKTDVYLMMKEV
ncbi:hypothetical protein FGRMN_4872 [Fusarium graminum]|nr:hypothetical protein FGRMN_4872 [Fusarium graminum]